MKDESPLWMFYLQGMPRLSRLTLAFLSASYDEFLTQTLFNLTYLGVVPPSLEGEVEYRISMWELGSKSARS